MMNKIIVKIKLDDLAKIKQSADCFSHAAETAAHLRGINEQLTVEKADMEQKIKELTEDVERLEKYIFKLKHPENGGAK